MPPRSHFPAAIIRRGRTPFFNSWSKFPFLELPGEIRNKIYGFLVPEADVEVSRNRHGKEAASQGESKDTTKMMKRRLYPITTIRVDHQYEYDLIRILRTLLLVSRQINQELIPLIYTKWSFCFTSMGVFHSFINTAPEIGIQSISNLVLSHSTYGEPRYTHDRTWKIKHDNRWLQTCTRIATELSSLQSLDMSLIINDWPTQLTPDAEWVQPLMVLKGNGLDYVRLSLRHDGFPEKRCITAGQTIEDLMMTAEGREKRDLKDALRAIRDMERKEAEKAQLPRVRARKTLVITIPVADTKKTIVAPVHKPVVKTKGLEKFHRVDLATANVAFCY